MKKVIVLLSTYNGDKYLSEFLDSVMNQTYSNFELFIRDDGSTDNTIKILKQYEKKYNKIHLILDGNNLGYPACFYYLTDCVSKKADYYFFADQDDVWQSNKIERALSKMKQYSSDEILAYYADYYICDEKLNVVGTFRRKYDSVIFQKTIYEVCGLEFTMAINRCALLFLNQNKPIKSKARGVWMSMLFSSFGKIIYDHYPCAFYRRHDSSVTSDRMSGVGLWIWRVKHFFYSNEFSSYKIILNDFFDVVGERLNCQDKSILCIFIGNNRFRKAFFVGRLRSSILDEFALRFVFLLGKL